MKRKRAFEKLQSALVENKRVHIKRVFDRADVLEGYVVAVGDEWTLLWLVDSNYSVDGWAALRIADLFAIQKVNDREHDDVQRRILSVSGEWPPSVPVGCNVSGLPAILAMANGAARLISLHKEAAQPDRFWVGRTTASDERHVTLEELDPGARWDRSRVMDSDDITRVDFGSIYMERLALVMEPFVG